MCTPILGNPWNPPYWNHHFLDFAALPESNWNRQPVHFPLLYFLCRVRTTRIFQEWPLAEKTQGHYYISYGAFNPPISQVCRSPWGSLRTWWVIPACQKSIAPCCLWTKLSRNLQGLHHHLSAGAHHQHGNLINGHPQSCQWIARESGIVYPMGRKTWCLQYR